MSNIERSQGLPIDPVMGFVAGGGGRGATTALDDVVQYAAEALSALYEGAPVTIRFNSDRMSGGAWLKTAEQDYIGGNAEVGITASEQNPGVVSATIRRISRAGDDWETAFAEREGASVATVDEAISVLREMAVTDFRVLKDRIAILTERKRRNEVAS